LVFKGRSSGEPSLEDFAPVDQERHGAANGAKIMRSGK
jgi:hypothetical protein